MIPCSFPSDLGPTILLQYPVMSYPTALKAHKHVGTAFSPRIEGYGAISKYHGLLSTVLQDSYGLLSGAFVLVCKAGNGAVRVIWYGSSLYVHG